MGCNKVYSLKESQTTLGCGEKMDNQHKSFVRHVFVMTIVFMSTKVLEKCSFVVISFYSVY